MAGEVIRPSSLPPRVDPIASEIVPSDNGSIVAGVTWEKGVAAGRPLASQAEAEAGINSTKAMTPLTTKQAIQALAPALSDGNKGDVTVSGSGAAWALNSAVVSRAKLTSALSKTIGISVFEYGAVGDNATNDGVAFATAQAAAIVNGSKLVVVPAGNYRINTQIDIAADVTWLFLGARLTTTLDTIKMFSAVTVDGWAFLGDVRLVGSLSAPASSGQYGLYLDSCNRYRVEGVTATNLKGVGFWLTGTASPGERGDRGQFTSCAAYDCTIGRQIDAGAGGEYTIWTNWSASDCATADIIGAGNTVTVGGSIVDNDVGVQLVAGSNHGHGIYSAVQINHNTTNVTAEDITYGFMFAGCNVHEGPLAFDNCAGIVFDGGIIDISAVTNVSGADSGPIIIRNMWWDDSYGPTGFSGTGIATVIVQNCTGPGVPTRNQFHLVEVHAYRNKGSTQALTSATAATIIFPSETADTSSAYDASTGVFTVPADQDGLYEVAWSVVAGGTGLDASASFVELQVDGNGGGDSYSSQVLTAAAAYGTTLLTFNGSASLRLAAGANVRMRANVTGTSPVIGATDWYCLLSIKKLGS